MIEDYKIVNNNGSEILYLYLNYEYEFASFFDKNKIKDIKDYIVHFISNKKIKFNGNKIVLILNGIIISSIFFGNNISYKEPDNIKYVVCNETLFKDNIKSNIKKSEEKTIDLEKELSVQNEETKIIDNNISNKNETTNRVSNNEKVINIESKLENAQNNVSTDNGVKPVEEVNQVIENQKPIIEEVKKEKMINIARSDGTILNINFEDYIIGVIGAEMPASFNIEALKSQAIIARTYALKRLEEGKILSDTTINQVYKDNNQLRSLWGNEFDKYYNKIKSAAVDTKGEVIKYNGKYIDAVYHSTSNGLTEDPIFVWGYSIPYLKSVDSHWDINASSYIREVFYTSNDFSNLIAIDINDDTPINVIDRSTSNRINNVQIGDKIINGVDLYNLLSLRSRDFEININNSIVTITTKGYGHGVGLSQYGSNGMANEGYNYKDIINHYYTNVKIVKEDL